MNPIHSVEYEVTSAWVTQLERELSRWEWRRGVWQDAPQYAAAVIFAGLLVWLVLQGLVLPGVGGGLMALLMFFVLGVVYRRWGASRSAVMTAFLAIHSGERSVRIEFDDQRVRLETGYFRGEGEWSELEQIVIFSDFWILYLSNGGRILLPSARVSSELAEFLRSKALQVMAPIYQQTV